MIIKNAGMASQQPVSSFAIPILIRYAALVNFFKPDIRVNIQRIEIPAFPFCCIDKALTHV